MCIRVEVAPRASLDDPYNAATQVITIPAGYCGPIALRAVRAVLDQLDVEQPRTGARCWCGEPIQLSALIPQQRRSSEVSDAS